MSSGCSKSRDFFESGTPAQFEWVLTKYDDALSAKAHSKSSRPENVIKLDKWYQNELPKKIKGRGKDAHLTHDEIVQTIKWKLARGKYRPNLTNLVQMNTPRVVMNETKKAFRNIFKRGDIQAAATALCNLKGVGPGMASAILAAGAPHLAPFMADECLWAMPDTDSLDYTMKEYMKFVEMVNECVERLNNQQAGDKWTPHRVELAVWTYYILNDLKPDVLVDMVGGNAFTENNGVNKNNTKNDEQENNDKKQETNGAAVESAEDSNPASSLDESSNPPALQDDDSCSQNPPESENGGDNSDNQQNGNSNGSNEDSQDTNGGGKQEKEEAVNGNGNGVAHEVVSEDSSSIPSESTDPSTDSQTKKRASPEEVQENTEIPPEKKTKPNEEEQQAAVV